MNPGEGPGPDGRQRKQPRHGASATGDAAVIVPLYPAADSARPVVELGFGILVYPPEADGEPWRAAFTENGQRRYRQGATEAKLAAKLEKVTERLSAGAANMERPGADLIAHYLDPDRLPVQDRWSRKHAHTQRRLCERFAAPVIGAVTCQDIKIWHTQQIVNAAPTAGEGARVAQDALRPGRGGHRRRVPDQPAAGQGALAGRGPPAARPAGNRGRGIGAVGRPRRDPRRWRRRPARPGAGRGRHGERDELMASTAAYSGLRWGELTALTTGQVDTGRPRHHGGPQGGRGRRAPLHRGAEEPQVPQDDLPAPHARRLPARRAARRPHRGRPRRAGSRDQPARADLPLPEGQATGGPPTSTATSSSAPTSPPAGVTARGNGRWTWHSLRHVFCTTALFTWKLDATDVSCMAGHTNVRTTLLMYVGSTAGVLDRARTATN